MALPRDPWNQWNELRDARQVFSHPDGAHGQCHAVWARQRTSDDIRLTARLRFPSLHHPDIAKQLTDDRSSDERIPLS